MLSNTARGYSTKNVHMNKMIAADMPMAKEVVIVLLVNGGESSANGSSCLLLIAIVRNPTMANHATMMRPPMKTRYSTLKIALNMSATPCEESPANIHTMLGQVVRMSP